MVYHKNMFAIFREIISNVILERFWPHVRVNWALSTETLDIPAGNRPYIFWTVARLYIPRSYIWSTYTGNSIIQGTECFFRFFVPFFSFSWSKSSWLSFFFFSGLQSSRLSDVVCGPNWLYFPPARHYCQARRNSCKFLGVTTLKDKN